MKRDWSKLLVQAEVVPVEGDRLLDGPPPIPCGNCPEFEAVTYPSTPDSAEEYDTFCNALMGDGVFLRFMEGQNDENDSCPYYDLLQVAKLLGERLSAEKLANDDTYYGTAESELRGAWLPMYEDGEETTRCPECNCEPTEEGHDACLGTIPGAISACCGHGAANPYVVYPDVETLKAHRFRESDEDVPATDNNVSDLQG